MSGGTSGERGAWVSSEEAWLTVWAKTGREPQNPAVVTGWLPLHEHLADAAAVGGLLVDRWVSPQVIARIARDVNGDAADVRRLVAWLASVHDVGKASPAFAVQDDELADVMRRRGLLASPALKLDPQRSRARHEFVGQLAVRNWLIHELGFAPRGAAARQLGSVVGSHHGVPPTTGDLALVHDRKDLSGTGEWGLARAEILRWASDLVGGPEAIKSYADAQLGRPSQALLTAIVIMADWVASNVEYFPLDPLRTAHEPPRRPDAERTAARAAVGWAQLDLPPRWTPQPIGDVQAAFAARFARELGSARPVQVAAAEAARAQEQPGMVIVEAPMGEGKTEAALLAAEVLAERSGADGCFVALPTRATSDAMFSRVLAWMEGLPGLPVGTSVTLAHGTASLNDTYNGLLRDGYMCGVGEGTDEAVVAHYWLRGRKRGPLAQFVIGTIDQVLFAGLKSRHLMLRHLALAGKVVIIDEVHAYDVYMSRYLDRVLHWLGAYGTPVVLLSATLPAGRRAELMSAYESGRGAVSPAVVDDPGYPVVVASGLTPRQLPASREPMPVGLDHLLDDLDALVVLLRERLAGGGCAVVVRNTVGRVQETADRLVEEFGQEHVTVNHSRFLACDRARTDRELLRRFGPPGPDTDRPALHVVVASQVVEQSLDVDFDLMVTDLAPVDLVLQRIGRLHRHPRPRPAGMEKPRCVLVGVKDWAADPVRAVPGSRRVYGEHTLLRSSALLSGRETIVLPTDIAPLVQAGYGEGIPGPKSWREAMQVAQEADRLAADRRKERAGEFLLDEPGLPTATLDGWVRAGVGDADEDPRGVAQVRDGSETVEVLVVQRDRDGGLLTPAWIERGGGQQIPLDLGMSPQLARTIAACALRLPLAISHERIVEDVIAALERNHYPSFDLSPLLSGQLVLVLDDDGRADLRHGDAAFRLTYDLRRGLLYEPI
jgi:CRISPR-associated helicase Cas3/CRISPR-associated endonuclease Cas3-HD